MKNSCVRDATICFAGAVVCRSLFFTAGMHACHQLLSKFCDCLPVGRDAFSSRSHLTLRLPSATLSAAPTVVTKAFPARATSL